MKIVKYNKLVRDKIPEIIEADGCVPSYHLADDTEYKEKLLEKLLEETAELLEAIRSNPEELDDIIKELADVDETLRAICDHLEIDKDDVKKKRKERAEKRGKFEKKIILDEVEEKE